ncbi:hypothetical protein [Comamonas sp. NoAH]|nr:hypothetical protein [Comamonas sp. NoAH]
MQTRAPTTLGIDFVTSNSAMLWCIRTHVARLLPLQGKLAHSR